MLVPFKYNLKSIWQRKGRTVLTVFGIALVVANFIMMSSMAGGLISGFSSTGSKDNVIVLQKGAMYLDFSSLPKPFLNIIKYVKHVKVKEGVEWAAPEAFISTWVTKNKNEYSVMARGITPLAYKLHNQVKIIRGRRPETAGEILIGKMVKFIMKQEALGPGDTLEMFGSSWTIVGEFEAEDSTFESEIWTRLNDLLVAANQDVYSCVLLKAGSPSSVPLIVQQLNDSKHITVKAMPEREYYASVSVMFIAMKVMGILITIIASLAAVFIGINTMFTSIMGRIREIGTLQALGFSKRSIQLSFIFESFLIAFAGGVVGVMLALPLNGVSMNMLVVAFQFKIGWSIILQGLVLASVLGVLGGIAPARRAAKLKVVEAIRHV